MKHPEIKLTGCQIKSLKIARKLAKHLDSIETLIGIRATVIAIADPFICPEITDEELDTLNRTPMEKTLRAIIRQIRAKG